MAYTNAKEGTGIIDYAIGIESFTSATTYDDCPPTANIIFGRLFMSRFLTTFRVAANGGDKMIALSIGKSQYYELGFWDYLTKIIIIFGLIMLLVFIVCLILALRYFVANKKSR